MMNESDKIDNSNSLRIVGAWTKAGVTSCIHITGHSKDENMLMDCGHADISTHSARVVFLTHGHIDHSGGCFSYARAKALKCKFPTKFYVPETVYKPFLDAKFAFDQLDGQEIPMEIYSMRPGEAVSVSKNVYVVAFPTTHRVPSQGYAIYSKRNCGLKSEYLSLSQSELKSLSKSGTNLVNIEETLEIVYTGDTTFHGLLSSPFIFDATVFIVELTYIDGDRRKAIERTHVHLDDIVEYSNLFINVKQLRLVHLSQKYSASAAIEALKHKLPHDLLQKTVINLALFGVNETFTSPIDERWSIAHRTEVGWGWANRQQKKVSGEYSPKVRERYYKSLK